MSQDLFPKISEALLQGEPELTVDLVRQALESGFEPMEIINRGLVPGMDVAGDRFDSGEFFLPDLMVSADCMQKSMALLEPELVKREQAIETPGTVVIGTVWGDIHEIGKSLVATMLAANGFKVHDLGVDVTVEKFVAKVKETRADILGMSALLTTTMIGQQEVIQALEQAGLRSEVKVIVGGAPVTRSWADEIGADGYAEDATSAVLLAKELMDAS
jgi:corrinoid protein of di/trimethylamine methyltransferase